VRVLDLFSGIGGFSLGLERAGFETVAFCEIEDYPRKVLAKHWPGVPIYDDVRTLTAGRLASDGIAGIEVITGGFPCQDLSIAGNQAGITTGTRSGLWSEIVRLVGEIRPKFIIVENVANLLRGPSNKPGRWFGRVLGDLAECGYDAEWHRIPAALAGRPIFRDRIWLVSFPMQVGQPCMGEQFSFPSESVFNDGLVNAIRHRLDKSPFLGVADGLPHQLDRLAALGNAVVPQIPELIGRAIMELETKKASEDA